MATFLSPGQREKIAAAIDKEINIPLVSNRRERDIFIKLVEAIDNQVNAKIPDEMLNGLNSPNIQIEDAVAEALKQNLVPLLDDLLAIPFLPRSIKRQILSFVIEMLVDAMASQTTLDEKVEAFLAIE